MTGDAHQTEIADSWSALSVRVCNLNRPQVAIAKALGAARSEEDRQSDLNLEARETPHRVSTLKRRRDD